MIVQAGTQSRSRSEVVRPDGLTDIPVLWIELFQVFEEHDPHAIVECKRIGHTKSRLCRDYISEGVDRFRSGKYSLNHAVAFMVGYVVDGTEDSAVDAINRRLERIGRLEERLTASALITEPWVYASSHFRERADPVRLHHAFLNFRRSE